jgi:hypothetical protein
VNDRPTPEITVLETARAAAADVAELAAVVPGDAHRTAEVADKLSEELAELAAMLRALPGRPAGMSGHDYQLLSALSTARASGEDVGEFLGRGLARLAAELGGSKHVLARPGSWEAGHVRALLAGLVGEADEDLGRWATS